MIKKEEGIAGIVEYEGEHIFDMIPDEVKEMYDIEKDHDGQGGCDRIMLHYPCFIAVSPNRIRIDETVVDLRSEMYDLTLWRRVRNLHMTVFEGLL